MSISPKDHASKFNVVIQIFLGSGDFIIMSHDPITKRFESNSNTKLNKIFRQSTRFQSTQMTSSKKNNLFLLIMIEVGIKPSPLLLLYFDLARVRYVLNSTKSNYAA